jgi:hypothetical protein
MGKKLEKRFNEELAKGDKANLNFCDSFFAKAAGYAWGQPTKRSEISGRDGGPILKQTQILEASQRVADAFAEAADSEDPAEKMNDESIGAASAINFVLAAKEAAQRAAGEHLAPSRLNGAAKPEASVAAPEDSPESFDGPVDPVPPQPGQTVAFLETDFRIVGLEPDRPNLPPMFALHGSAGLMCRGNWGHVLGQAKKRAGELGHWIIQQPRASNDPLLLAPNR